MRLPLVAAATLVAALAAVMVLPARLQADPPAGKPAVAPMTAAEMAAWKAKETPEQKALRAAVKNLGRIYFSSNADGVDRIYSIKPDGSDEKCLTPAATHPLGGTYPHLSADCSKLAFSAGTYAQADKATQDKLACDPAFPWNKRYYKQASLIWLANGDGSNARPVAAGSMPHMSPDGTRIAYMATLTHARDNKPAILDLRTNPPTEKILVAPFKFTAGMPAFTPDGKSLIVSNGTGFLLKLNDKGNDLDLSVTPQTLIGGHPCNTEISNDGKWVTWVCDTEKNFGSWLQYGAVEELKNRKGVKSMPLGWPKKSVNYFPDFSPDNADYYVYSHGDMQEGVKSWLLSHHQEIYVTDFPACKATIRLTFNNASNAHPHWAKK